MIRVIDSRYSSQDRTINLPRMLLCLRRAGSQLHRSNPNDPKSNLKKIKNKKPAKGNKRNTEWLAWIGKISDARFRIQGTVRDQIESFLLTISEDLKADQILFPGCIYILIWCCHWPKWVPCAQRNSEIKECNLQAIGFNLFLKPPQLFNWRNILRSIYLCSPSHQIEGVREVWQWKSLRIGRRSPDLL